MVCFSFHITALLAYSISVSNLSIHVSVIYAACERFSLVPFPIHFEGLVGRMFVLPLPSFSGYKSVIYSKIMKIITVPPRFRFYVSASLLKYSPTAPYTKLKVAHEKYEAPSLKPLSIITGGPHIKYAPRYL